MKLGWMIIAAAAFGATAAYADDLTVKSPLKEWNVLPAVDGLNAELEAVGGSIANRAVYGVQSAVSIPIAHSFGLQVDAARGSFDARAFDAVGAHGFWRDPSRGLLGVYTSYTNWDNFGGLHVERFGAEGAAYLGRWTVEAVVGTESGNTQTVTAGATIQTFTIKTRLFDKVDIAYYLTDDWKISVGHSYFGGNHAAAIRTEYAFDPGWQRGVSASIFAEGRVGENNTSSVLGGLKFYFGQKDKTLIRRNREDDPAIGLTDGLSGLSNNKGNSTAPAPATGCLLNPRGPDCNATPTPTGVTPPPTCTAPQVLTNGQCVTPGPNSGDAVAA